MVFRFDYIHLYQSDKQIMKVINSQTIFLFN
nr:MAG TPA: hypothetical protein [Herelleviridae sp.]